jgi:hypothetical protein
MRLSTILITALFALSAASVSAQKVTLENVSTRSFSGVQSINGQYYYTFYFGEKSETKGMANFVLALYDKDLTPIVTKNIEVSKNSELAASSFSGKYFLFMFADVNRKTLTKIVMDQTGNITKQVTEEDVRRSLLVADNYPNVEVLSEDEFLIIRPEKDKKMGYEVERMDKDLTIKWTKQFFPEKGIWSVIDTRLAAGKLFLLRRDKPNALWGDKFVYTVQSINPETGDAIYTTELKDDKDGGFPSFIRVSADGKLATGGMYFNDGKFDDKNSDGFFFATVEPDGKLSNFGKHTWKSVKDDVAANWLTEFSAGKTKVLIEELIQKKDGGYALLGETFRKTSVDNTGGEKSAMSLGGFGSSSSSSSSYTGDQTGFTVLDFMIFNFDASGNFLGIDKVEKTSREAVVRGSMSKENGLSLAQWMANKKRYFGYRYMIDYNDKQYIVYKNEDGFKTKAYFIQLAGLKTVGDLDLDKWMGEGMNKLGRFSKMTGGNKKTFESTVEFGQPESYEIYKNVIPAKPGSVLMYEFSNSKLNMWLEPIPTM